MEEKYDFHKIEEKWRNEWKCDDSGKAEDFSKKPKHYHLIEFPYPSGASLHVGNCMSYGASDAYVRMKRMQGFNVLFPIGWDAFGLPTENNAIKNKIQPKVATKQNIEIFRKQMLELGYSFNFDREVDTTDPDYYQWTQWIFLQFYKHAIIDDPSTDSGQAGKLVSVADDDTETPRLAFQAEMPVNWCPSCKIILANEEVIGGKCERCGAQTERRKQKQWMLRITAYADRLIKDLDTVDYLPQIKIQQINWIGRSEGTEIRFTIKGSKPNVNLGKSSRTETAEKMLEVIDKVSKQLSGASIKMWVNGTWAVAGYYGEIFEEPADIDLGVLEKDFREAKRIIEELGYEKIDDEDNGKFKVSSYHADEFELQIGTFDHDLGDNEANLGEHRFLIPNPKWLAECYRTTATKVRRKGKNDLQRAEFLESINDPFIDVFTTRADTLFGVTYIVLAPEHALVERLKQSASNINEINKYIEDAKKKSDMDRTELAKDKTGVKLEGISAINPINNEEVDIYIADYVLATYGTGAVMAVPAHDERDWEFAQKYDIPIIEVIIPKLIDKNDPPLEGLETVEKKQVYAVVIDSKNNKVLARKWKKFPWIGLVTGGIEQNETIIDTAKREILEETGYKNVKYVRTLGGPIEVHFHAAHKNVNRKATYYPLVFELVNDEQEQLSDKEAEEAETFWADWDELENMQGYVLPVEHELVRDRFQNPAHAFEEYGVLINSSEYDDLSSADAKKKITERLKEIDAGDFAVNFKLRDWIFSRQHYWGEPIPIVHCDKCGTMPLSESDLPLVLPEVEDYHPTDTGESPLATITNWVETECPKCGGKAKRETDTMPNWAGSSWYYLAYCISKKLKSQITNHKHIGNIFLENKKELEYWMPVDLYNGGNEHTTLHLLYSRFWNKFLYDLKVVPTSEPYKKRIAHGIILGADGRKMSKSFGNVINPDDMIKKFGADTLRAYIMFIGPYDKESAWNMDGMMGVYRFINKLWENFKKLSNNAKDEKLEKEINKLIGGVDNDINNFLLNTYIAKLMEFNNILSKETKIPKSILEKFAQLFAPAMPFLAEELWCELGNTTSVFESKWPVFDKSLISDEKVTIVIQINGKIRDRIEVIPDLPEEKLKDIVFDLASVQSHLKSSKPRKVIIVPNKIVSIVL